MNLVTCRDFTLMSTYWPSIPLFEPLTFNVKIGDILGVVGPNGIGKSLFLSTISTGVAPRCFRTQGEIVTLSQRIAKEVFFLSQLLAPDVHMPFLLWEVAAFDAGSPGKYPWFDGKIASKSWNNASGGERMRALLARAFSSNRQLLLLDEPFNHLDSQTAESVREQMRAYVNAGNNRAIIFISHAEGDLKKNLEGDNSHFPILNVQPPTVK